MVQDEDDVEEIEEPIIYEIVETVNHIGYYLDEEIFEFIEIEDGRIFEFAGIAQRIPGTEDFYGVHETKETMVTHPGLLYYEIIE